MKQPAEKVEVWPLASIVPYKHNPRVHPPEQITLLARFMKEHGVDQPIVVDENGVIIKGHGRLLAARLADMTTFPVVVKRGLSEDQKRAERIADNQIALLASWDTELIRIELGELQVAGYELPLLGFNDTSLATLLDTNPGYVDPEEAPDVPVIPVSQAGDLWRLGRHRLLCGDATNAEDVALLLGSNRPHLMVTDPPWGVNYKPEWRDKAIHWYAGRRRGLVANDDRVDWAAAWALFPGDVAYTWHPAKGEASRMHYDALMRSDLEPRMQIIWAKTNHVIGRGNYHVQHEPCWYAVRKGKTAHWQGARNQTTLWSITLDNLDKKVEGGHSTQKPIECMKRPIENNSKAGEAVYDPFVGSGTTLIAAELTGRKAFVLEIDPRYCDVVVERWQKFTGRKAVLDGHGRHGSFQELAPERREANKDWKFFDKKKGHPEVAPAEA